MARARGRQVFNLDFQPVSEAPFHASFKSIFDARRILQAEFSPGLTIRSKELLEDGGDAFGLVIALSRNLEITQRGREFKFGRGEATLLALASRASWVCANISGP